ncbi:MAG TPA: hypothetical protein VMA86_07890 [Acetobacteraceae bacterium]|nr:hypothetical protein [Acetobacteraceae bacterium]
MRESAAEATLAAELIAVMVAANATAPRILTVEDGRALPSGPFASSHRSLQSGLRAWVEERTRHPLGYVEQLYTFADRDRTSGGTRRAISISYLGLTREAPAPPETGASWQDWYRYFPWEDRREGEPAVSSSLIAPALRAWAKTAPAPWARRERSERAAIAFGLSGQAWNEEFSLQRYELLYEAGLVPEAGAAASAARAHATSPAPSHVTSPAPSLGTPMLHDHRRILATGIARLRAKIKYRPVVFELMPPAFTLLELQLVVEALAGMRLHKQNFRRLVARQELVEETGAMIAETGGRPARLFRFRRAVLRERAASGTKLPLLAQPR